MKFRFVLAVATVAVIFTACEKNDVDEQPLKVTTVTNLAADTTIGFSSTGRPIGANAYTYFSLRENKIITGADTLTNKWDIAFKQFFIKINGGTSATGGGNAAAFIANSTFEAYTQIPENETSFQQDNGSTFAISPAPGAWYSYNPATFIALPVPGRIIVVRTADGRYAKLEITSLYKNGVTPDVALSPAQKALLQFFYQFRFVFQPNGSKSFL